MGNLNANANGQTARLHAGFAHGCGPQYTNGNRG